MHHLALNVPNLAASVSGMTDLGIEVGWSCPEVGLTLLESRSVGGMTFALSETS
jgi:hypothetical protein